METNMMFQLIIGYLEYSYEEFQKYLEEIKEIDGTEAELIIADLEKIMGQKNETTKSN